MSRFPRERFPVICSVCGSEFSVIKSRLSKAKYCSNKCRSTASLKNSNALTCAACGDAIKEKATHRDQMARHAATRFFCSRECFYAFSLLDRPIGTKRVCAVSGFVFVKMSNDKWRAEHRVVAESVIKRGLHYCSEPILHIDGDPANNHPYNLYICKDQSEMNIILKSYTIPYPVRSNLEWYT